jgi:hypothetical protein
MLQLFDGHRDGVWGISAWGCVGCAGTMLDLPYDTRLDKPGGLSQWRRTNMRGTAGGGQLVKGFFCSSGMDTAQSWQRCQHLAAHTATVWHPPSISLLLLSGAGGWSAAAWVALAKPQCES